MSITNIFAFLVVIIAASLLYYKHFYNTNIEQQRIETIEFEKGQLKKVDTVDIALLGGIAMGIVWLVGRYGLAISVGGVSVGKKQSTEKSNKTD